MVTTGGTPGPVLAADIGLSTGLPLPLVAPGTVALGVLALALVLAPGRPGRSRLAALWPAPRLVPRLATPHTGLVVAGATLPGWALAGPGGALAAALLAWSLHRRALRRRRERATTETAAEMVDALRRIADELRAGAHPAAALDGIRADGPLARAVLAPAAVAARLGESVPAVLARQAAARPGIAGDLERVAGAWALADRHGIPLADLLENAHTELRWRLRHAARVRADLAGPRATAAVLTALPALGVLLGQLVGADPVAVLRDGPLGQVLLVSGVALTLAGSAWSDQILRRAVPS